MENSNSTSWLNLPKPILALAPMADLTDGPFCRVCREVSERPHPNPPLQGEGKNKKNLPLVGGGKEGVSETHKFVIFREMVSAEAIVRGNEKTLKMCEFEAIEKPIVLQLFGSSPEIITEAARIITERFLTPMCIGVRNDNIVIGGIDVNMGCPVPKIASRGHAGADLMRDPERAVNIVKALKKANLGVPISVKTRLGWASEAEILRFAPLLEQAGVDCLTVHGRTKKQGYSGQANWEAIAKVVKLLSIPVIANGDIKNSEDIKKCLEVTGADGVMIGRAALGNPWVFSSIIPPPCRGRLGGGLSPAETSPLPPLRSLSRAKPREGEGIVCVSEIIRVVLRHAELHLERYGDRGMMTFRKHLLYYFKGFDGAVELRRKLVKVETLSELKKILADIDRY